MPMLQTRTLFPMGVVKGFSNYHIFGQMEIFMNKTTEDRKARQEQARLDGIQATADYLADHRAAMARMSSLREARLMRDAAEAKKLLKRAKINKSAA
jgi:hypothetical protein